MKDIQAMILATIFVAIIIIAMLYFQEQQFRQIRMALGG